MHRGIIAAALVGSGLLATAASAQVDNVKLLLNQATGTGAGVALGGFTYSPLTDEAWVAGFGGTGEIRKITGFSTVSPTFTTLIGNNTWTLFNKNGNGGRTGGAPTIGNFIINPLPIAGVTATPYSLAAYTDGGGVVFDQPSNTRRNDLTNRLVRYDLNTTLTSIATKATTLTVAGLDPVATSTSDNVARQPAWSPDGQRVYWVDTGAYGGIWRSNVAAGTTQRVIADPNIVACEPTSTASGTAGVDRVYYSATTGNVNYVDHDVVAGTSGAVQTRLSASQIQTFLDSTSSPDVRAISSDSAGNIYFSDIINRNVLRLDPQGRLVKVLSYAERVALYGGNPNSNASKASFRDVSFNNGIGGPTFNVTQYMYAEQAGSGGGVSNVISGAFVFTPGDFDRDNDVDTTDITAFKSKLTTRGVTTLVTADYKYDLTGTRRITVPSTQYVVSIDWADVKALQPFVGFANGDADINLSLDYNDINTVKNNYNGTGKIWTNGDFTGDDVTNYADLQNLAAAWLAIPQAKPTLDNLDAQGYTGQFRKDVITAFVLPMWNINGSGNWNTAGNWQDGVEPNSATAAANFLFVAQIPSVVSLLSNNVTVNQVNFDNSSVYLVSGPFGITLAGTASRVRVYTGTHGITAPVTLAAATTLDVQSGSSILTLNDFNSAGFAVTKTGAGLASVNKISGGSAVNIVAGTLRLNDSGAGAPIEGDVNGLGFNGGNGGTIGVGSTSVLGSLTLAGGPGAWTSTLDIRNNDVVIRTGSDIDSVRDQVNHAYNGGLWDLAGVTSSRAAADGLAVGYGSNLDLGYTVFSGAAVNPADMLVKYTWFGDANLDGQVDGDDYLLWLAVFGSSGSGIGWGQGDFDYDQDVDGDDYLLWLQNFGNGIGSPLSAVPEPGVLGLALVAGAGLLARRRRS